MATPHIEAKSEDISKLVLLTGDPNRAKFIAENYLQEYRCINNVRGMLGYTGLYKGKIITVMSHGMGIPSMGIYSYELFNFYNVEAVIRIGTAGSYTKTLNVLDVLLVDSSYSLSSYSKNFDGTEDIEIPADTGLNNIILKTAKEENIDIKRGKVHSSDVFYTTKEIYNDMRDKYNLSAVEMESYALFKNASYFNKKASCILTISDSFITKKELSSKEREVALDKMIKLALESIIKL